MNLRERVAQGSRIAIATGRRGDAGGGCELGPRAKAARPRAPRPRPPPPPPPPPRGDGADGRAPKSPPPLPAIPPLRSKRAPPWSPSPAPPFQGPSAGTPHPPQHATGHNCSIFKKIIEDQSL